MIKKSKTIKYFFIYFVITIVFIVVDSIMQSDYSGTGKIKFLIAGLDILNIAAHLLITSITIGPLLYILYSFEKFYTKGIRGKTLYKKSALVALTAIIISVLIFFLFFVAYFLLGKLGTNYYSDYNTHLSEILFLLFLFTLFTIVSFFIAFIIQRADTNPRISKFFAKLPKTLKISGCCIVLTTATFIVFTIINIRSCGALAGATVLPYRYDLCFAIKALEQKNIDVCKLSKDIDNCFMELAYLMSDADICKKIKHKLNSSLCSSIINPPDDIIPIDNIVPIEEINLN